MPIDNPRETQWNWLHVFHRAQLVSGFARKGARALRKPISISVFLDVRSVVRSEDTYRVSKHNGVCTTA